MHQPCPLVKDCRQCHPSLKLYYTTLYPESTDSCFTSVIKGNTCEDFLVYTPPHLDQEVACGCAMLLLLLRFHDAWSLPNAWSLDTFRVFNIQLG